MSLARRFEQARRAAEAESAAARDALPPGKKGDEEEPAPAAAQPTDAAPDAAQAPSAAEPVPPGTETASPVAVASPAAPATPAQPTGPSPVAAAPAPPPATRLAQSPAREDLLRTIRVRLQGEVSGAFASLVDAKPDEVQSRIEGLVDKIITANQYAVTRDEHQRLVEEMVGEIAGLGPLEPLLKDGTITEVMVNGPDQIYIERRGKIERINRGFLNDDHVLRIIDRIVTPIGRRIDQSSPRVDARLPDGSRVNAIIPPLSLVGPVITIRKFSQTPYTIDDLIGFGTATAEMFEFLRVCVEAKLNLFVSGGTGSGKTTTLNVISSFIPEEERIITVEDAAELQLDQQHVVTLEARPPNLEGRGEITIRDLLRNCLHMRPDRIIVGECRSGEALDMIQAMTIGQEGSLSTGHANSPEDMLRRLETMVLMAGVDLPLRSIREQIASAVDLIVHTARLKDGSRKIVSITEVYGIEDEDILTQEIFVFEQTGIVDGKIEGVLRPTGIRPTFMKRFQQLGIQLPPGDFGIPPEDPEKPTPPGKGRWGTGEKQNAPDPARLVVGLGRAVKAGGMVYVTSMGPVDPESGRVVNGGTKEHARQCLENLKAKLEAEGSSLDKVVWASWCLRDPGDFESFNEEWAHWFPGDTPIGQGTLMPQLQRRAGFRVSIGVIAEA
jgi:pilus assembly protein CpaF